jgi:hypothetical protein
VRVNEQERKGTETGRVLAVAILENKEEGVEEASRGAKGDCSTISHAEQTSLCQLFTISHAEQTSLYQLFMKTIR